MQAQMFETRILPDGFIQIPELSNWLDFEVSVFIVRKPKKKRKTHTQSDNIIASDCKRLLEEFHNVRKIRTGNTEVLTMEKAINIYDELTGLSRQ